MDKPDDDTPDPDAYRPGELLPGEVLRNEPPSDLKVIKVLRPILMKMFEEIDLIKLRLDNVLSKLDRM